MILTNQHHTDYIGFLKNCIILLILLRNKRCFKSTKINLRLFNRKYESKILHRNVFYNNRICIDLFHFLPFLPFFFCCSISKSISYSSYYFLSNSAASFSKSLGNFMLWNPSLSAKPKII